MAGAKDESTELGDAFWDRAMHPDPKALESWRETWSKVLGREQTLADAAEANRNFFGLLKVLAKIDARQRAEAKQDGNASGPSAGKPTES